MKALFGRKEESGEIVVQDAALRNVNIDASSHARLGWWIVLAGVGGFLLWATLAPLDKGVPVSGTVTVSGNRKAIQHQTGGTVEDILVKEGEPVKTGQVLVRMNDVQAKAAAEMTRAQYFAARMAEARLLAERDGKTEIDFPQELESARADLRVRSSMDLQIQLFASRRMAMRNELAALEESAAGLKAQLGGLEASRDSQKAQLSLLKEQLDNLRDLAKDGYVARNRVLELERTHAQLTGALAEGAGSIARAQRQLGEIALHQDQRRQEYQKEVRSQLADVQKEAEVLRNRLSSLDFELGNTLVKAPVDGVVVGMNVFTRGGVVASGYRMMDIVPADDPLIVEGQVPVNLIDKVHKELPVELVFSAFNQNRTPHIPGVVTQVSADRFVDEKTGVPYYRLHAQATPEGRKLLADLQVRPGMPVEVFVKTGERTLMSYLLKPVFDRAKSALTEE